MIGKIIALIFLIALLAFAGWFFYQNIPGSPEQFISNFRGNKTSIQEPVIYSEVKQFYPNMRFNHRSLTYYIDSSCTQKRAENIIEGFSIIQKEVTPISFSSSNEESADILVGCSEDYLEKEKNVFIAGEGGPTEIINNTIYPIILKGKVSLYKETKCDFPIVELHELLHVFGFDHTENPNSIMYNYSSCKQIIDESILTKLNKLYSFEALPDLYIENVSAVKKGRYLDFDIEVRNQGMINVNNVSLTLNSGSEVVEIYYLDEVDFGGGKKLYAKNVRLPSRESDTIKFVIDAEGAVPELRENNNYVSLAVA